MEHMRKGRNRIASGNIDFCVSHVVCTCIACTAVTLVIVAQMSFERNGMAVLVIGGLMTFWNIISTRNDYNQARINSLKTSTLPITAEQGMERGIRHSSRRKDRNDERKRSKRRHRLRERDSSLIKKSSSKRHERKAAKSGRKWRKNEKSRTTVAGLGASPRHVRI